MNGFSQLTNHNSLGQSERYPKVKLSGSSKNETLKQFDWQLAA